MKAEEARELSEKHKKINIEDALKSIKSAANRAEFSCWHYKQLTVVQKQQLTELGYTLSEESNYRNEYLIKISW